ncbi:uncharacterized protein LOC119734041 [Patiria miniata]|uniref:Uncharacterized protein n=1 Tax=Patiria miniata TaxID=46514 RepID=A0A914AH86_PATMI|nr:uncharacterized protein LOC119734041 [Patiria miniata]
MYVVISRNTAAVRNKYGHHRQVSNTMTAVRMLKLFLACLAAVCGAAMLYSLWIRENSQKGGVILRLDRLTSKPLYKSTASYSSEVQPIQRLGETNVSGITVKVSMDDMTRDVNAEKQLRVSSSIRHTSDFPEAGRPLIDLDRQDVDSDELFQRLVVVTAFSENHRLEVMGMIGTVQSRMPATRIIAYDLGIESKNLPQVRKLCNIEIRPFKFDRYPPHVSVLVKYAWKGIIIKEALDEFGVIFWADASVRFLDSLRTLLPLAKGHHGYFSRIHSYSPLSNTSLSLPVVHNFYLTDPRVFAHFGIERKEYARSPNTPHVAANRQLIINSTTVQEKVVRPLYACAMNETCISPPGTSRRNHMFDASALMLIFYKYWPEEFNRGNDHVSDMDKVTAMHRQSDDWSRAQFCELKDGVRPHR